MIRTLLVPALLALVVFTTPSEAPAQALPAQSIGNPEPEKPSLSAVQEVQRLVAAGRTADALALADSQLAKNPRDAQLRFVRAVILTDLKKTGEARSAFEKLTQEFPELPEPYNNLAVLYAADGQLDNARRALETAILAAPNYATAYENLGDVYLQLAADSFLKATKLEPANRQASAKLSLAREIIVKSHNVR